MEDVMSARGNHCNNKNKSTQECQGCPGEEVGKQCKEYREVQWEPLFAHPTLKPDCAMIFYLHHCCIFLEDRNTNIFQQPTKLKI